MREHQREYRESERLKRNLTGERKPSDSADSANFLAIWMISPVNELVSPLRQINFVTPIKSTTYIGVEPGTRSPLNI
jgi:hypothetical protein